MFVPNVSAYQSDCSLEELVEEVVVFFISASFPRNSFSAAPTVAALSLDHTPAL